MYTVHVHVAYDCKTVFFYILVLFSFSSFCLFFTIQKGWALINQAITL